MVNMHDATLCLLGCGKYESPESFIRGLNHPTVGNQSSAILDGLLNAPSGRKDGSHPFTHFIACVRSQRSAERLRDRFPQHRGNLIILRGDNAGAVKKADVIILGCDPADIETVLTEPGVREALTHEKLLISIAAGQTRQSIEQTLYGTETTEENKSNRAWVIRAMPNVGAQVSESLTSVEVSESEGPVLPERYLQVTTSIFEQIGKVVHTDPKLMNAATAAGGSTMAFFAVICDAFIDAAVAVGLPRDMARTMIVQSMKGTAAMLDGGMQPSLLKDESTSPEGCSIGGLMVLEEAGVRGHLGRALREAVTVARLMGTTPHVNDTRH